MNENDYFTFHLQPTSLFDDEIQEMEDRDCIEEMEDEEYMTPGCCFSECCLMPGFHYKDECHTAEMLESYYQESCHQNGLIRGEMNSEQPNSVNLAELILKLKGDRPNSFTIEFNQPWVFYQTVDEAIKDFLKHDFGIDPDNFVSSEDLQKSIQINEIWTVTWYKDSQVGHHIVHSYSLERCLQALLAIKDSHDETQRTTDA